MTADADQGSRSGIRMPSVGRESISSTTAPTMLLRWSAALMLSASTALLQQSQLCAGRRIRRFHIYHTHACDTGNHCTLTQTWTHRCASWTMRKDRMHMICMATQQHIAAPSRTRSRPIRLRVSVTPSTLSDTRRGSGGSVT